MTRSWSWQTSLVLVDMVAVASGFAVSYWLRFASGLIPAPKGIPAFDQHLGYLAFVLVVWLTLFRSCGLYRQRVQGTIDEAYSIVVGVAAGSVALLGAAYWQHAYWYSRGLLVIAAVVTASLMLLMRRMLRGTWHARYERGEGVVRAVLIGEESECARVATALAQPWTGYRILGRVAPPYPKQGEEIGEPTEASAVPELADFGTWDALLSSLKTEGVRPHEIILIGNCLRASDAQRLADACSATSLQPGSQPLCSLRLVPDVLDIVKRQSPVEEVVGIPMLTLSSQPVSLSGRIAKRLLDLAIALPLVLLLSPLLAVIAALVRASSPGPILYRQVRCGRDGHPFEMLKFRSMRTDAEQDGARWATRGDSRVTGIGRWLRRTSLDELPQLFNVLRGEMSLVGPRPERPVFVEKFGAEIPRYHERHRMPTGITGWAQVNGLRGDTPIRDRTLYDLYYVENWSVALDVKILLKTALEVLFHREAY